MEILLWLVPPVVATGLAMAWAGWVSRDQRGEVDQDEAVARIGSALAREHVERSLPRPQPPRDRSTGVAVRRSRGTH